MITRDILLDNFSFIDTNTSTSVNKETLSDLIDRWKYLLVSRGAKRGDSLGIAFVMVDADHLALLFAAAELGMCLLVLDKPVVEESIDRTRAAIFAPIDFLVIDMYVRKWPHYVKMVELYCNNIINVEEITTVTEKFTEFWGRPEDNYIGGSSSGTTGRPVPAYYTQEQSLLHAERCVRIFQYERDSVVCHTRNMHHVSSMLIGILPSLMSIEKHYFYNIYSDFDGFAEFIRDNNIDRAFIGSEWVIEGFVRAAMERGVRFNKTLLGSISGFTIPEEYVEYCRILNMELMSHLGAVGVAISPIVNHVTKDSVYKPNWLGKTTDDYYKIDVRDNIAYISSPETNYEQEIILQDYVSVVDGEWFHHGRLGDVPLVESEIKRLFGVDCNAYEDYLIIWNSDPIDIPEEFSDWKVFYLDKETWTTETKVNVYQLLGYLEKISN